MRKETAMDTTRVSTPRGESECRDDEMINVNKSERQLSVALGAALIGLGLGRDSKFRTLMLIGLGSALAYRGLTGRCGLYKVLGINTQSHKANTADAIAERPADSDEFDYGVNNQVDKDRFDKLKATQVERGRDEDRAIEIAAEEVKELRRREGRSKEEQAAFLAELDATTWVDK